MVHEEGSARYMATRYQARKKGRLRVSVSQRAPSHCARFIAHIGSSDVAHALPPDTRVQAPRRRKGVRLTIRREPYVEQGEYVRYHTV